LSHPRQVLDDVLPKQQRAADSVASAEPTIQAPKLFTPVQQVKERGSVEAVEGIGEVDLEHDHV